MFRITNTSQILQCLSKVNIVCSVTYRRGNAGKEKGGSISTLMFAAEIHCSLNFIHHNLFPT